MRRNRIPTITVHADPRSGLPSQLFNRVRPEDRADRAASRLFARMGWRVRGFAGSPRRAGEAPSRGAAADGVHRRLSVQFDPLHAGNLPGRAAGDHRRDGGASADQAAVRLHGSARRASPWAASRSRTRSSWWTRSIRSSAKGKAPYPAILDASVSRLRPVLLVAVTTVLGMIPLLQDPFFVAMAATIMFGLAFACVLTMIVVPVLYAIFFKVGQDAVETT